MSNRLQAKCTDYYLVLVQTSDYRTKDGRTATPDREYDGRLPAYVEGGQLTVDLRKAWVTRGVLVLLVAGRTRNTKISRESISCWINCCAR